VAAEFAPEKKYFFHTRFCSSKKQKTSDHFLQKKMLAENDLKAEEPCFGEVY
jgi:hypothetical protein